MKDPGFWVDAAQQGRIAEPFLDAPWTAPTTTSDGSPLNDLASYRVYCGPATAPVPEGIYGALMVAFRPQALRSFWTLGLGK